MPPQTTLSSSSSSSSSVYASALGFFLSMVGMELALEGANDAFPDLVALPYAVTLFQFGCCFALPIVLSGGKSLETFPGNLAGALPYVSLSTVVFGGTFLGTLSVRYVSYPTKVVFKSAKLIPTMIVASVWNSGGGGGTSNRYGWMEYLSAGLVCAGAAGYGLDTGSGTGGPVGLTSASSVGIMCLLASIFCDAFTPNLQQKLMAPPAQQQHHKQQQQQQQQPTTTAATTTEGPGLLPTTASNTTATASYDKRKKQHCCGVVTGYLLPATGMGLSARELMTNANGVGFFGLVIGMAWNGTLWEAIRTAVRHPVLLAYLLAVGGTLSVAVLCYTRLIREAGSVVAVAVATLRKVATVVLSYVVYPKPLSGRHVVSGMVVLAGILLSNHSKQRRQRRRRRKHEGRL